MSWARFAPVTVALVAAAGAQISTQGSIEKFPAYELVQGALDSDGFPTSGAKLCVMGPVRSCFQMPANSGYSQGGVTYNYGLEPRAQRLKAGRDGSVVLFSATFSGGGSGSLESLSLLRCGSDGRILNLLPFIALSEQSDHAAWQLPEISKYPILVTADYDWTKGETHFARHYYEVSAYELDPGTDRYVRLFRYRTALKYASLDEADTIHVIEPERSNILHRLEAHQPLVTSPPPAISRAGRTSRQQK